MCSIEVSLHDDLWAYVEEQVTSGGYGTASEYVRELIREDQKHKAQQKLEALLLEGLASPPREMTPHDWDDVRRVVTERLSQLNPET